MALTFGAGVSSVTSTTGDQHDFMGVFFSVTFIIEICSAIMGKHAIIRSFSLPTHHLASPGSTSLLHLFSLLLPCLDYFKAKIRLHITLSVNVADVSSKVRTLNIYIFFLVSLSHPEDEQ